MNENKCLKILSILLTYPEENWINEIDNLLISLKESNSSLIDKKTLLEIENFCIDVKKNDILVNQERYVRIFDRGRKFSLHLFEHIHGESRDRGQAMIDLLDHYGKYDLEIQAKELPDYLPLFLEFLSTIPFKEALNLLNECIHIINKITIELAKSGSVYTSIFNGLLNICGKPNISYIITNEEKELSSSFLNELDKEWKEESVDFLSNQFSYSNCNNQNQEIHKKINSLIEEKTTKNIIDCEIVI